MTQPRRKPFVPCPPLTIPQILAWADDFHERTPALAQDLQWRRPRRSQREMDEGQPGLAPRPPRFAGRLQALRKETSMNQAACLSFSGYLNGACRLSGSRF